MAAAKKKPAAQPTLGEEPEEQQPVKAPTLDEVRAALKGLDLVENGMQDLKLRLSKIEGEAAASRGVLERIETLMERREQERKAR